MPIAGGDAGGWNLHPDHRGEEDLLGRAAFILKEWIVSVRNVRIHRLFLVGFFFAATVALAQSGAPSPTREIHADLSQIAGPHSAAPLLTVGAGRANEGLRADWQRQLADVQTEIGFRYIRMHGLLNDDMGVYSEDAAGHPLYNFQYIDALYDALLRMNIRPFVELAFMPAKLASGDKTIFWWKGNVTPPKDPAKWSGLIRALLAHWRERYGEREIETWYYEVWNEPDLSGFFAGSLEEYLGFYKITAEAVKAECAHCRVGGPASASPFKYEQEFVKYCAANRVPADFVSTHSYGVKQGFLDQDGTTGTVLDSAPDAVSGRMRHSRELLLQSALPKLELHFTEWGSAYTATDPVHDQYHQASFLLDKIKRAAPYVDSLSYWTFTDIFEENGPRFTPFHGGFGLINYEGIHKPAFYAYEFLSRLGTTDAVDDDEQSWITESADGQVQALLWDYSPQVPPQGQNDQTYYKRDLPAQNKGNAHLTLTHVAPGTYWLRVYRIGYKVNDAYSDYLAMGAPSQLSPRQVEYLKEKNNGAPVSQEAIHIADGAFSYTLPLKTNDVYLLLLTKIAE
jgi:xylan 1,4-beta-xylosidase